MDPPDEVREVARVAFRVPPIWKSDIELWFLQVESGFVTAGITSETTKYHCVVSALDVEVLSCVRDILIAPPADNPYTSVKQRIIQQFAQSENVRLRTLLQDIHLGDKRPSQLLHEMQNLAAGKVSDEVLRTLFLQRLPNNVQQILSISKDNTTDLALVADKICEVSNFSAQISEIKSPVSATEFHELKKQIKILTDTLEKLSVNADKRNLNTRRKRSRSRTRSESVAGSKPLCWYHFKFGDKASTCVKPCSFAVAEN